MGKHHQYDVKDDLDFDLMGLGSGLTDEAEIAAYLAAISDPDEAWSGKEYRKSRRQARHTRRSARPQAEVDVDWDDLDFENDWTDDDTYI